MTELSCQRKGKDRHIQRLNAPVWWLTLCSRVIQVSKAPSRTSCKVLAKGCPWTWCLGPSKGVAKGPMWMEVNLVWHLRALTFVKQVSFSPKPLSFARMENRLQQPVVSCKHDPCSWGWLTSTRVPPALSHLTVSWHEPVNYKQGQLVRQAAIYSTSLFSCMHISLPSTARLMKANEKEDETKFLWWILLPFSKCCLSHFSAIGRDHDDNVSLKSLVLMISSLNGKLVIVGKDR